MGNVTSSEGNWSIIGSNVFTETINGWQNILEFSKDHATFRANMMVFSK